jgi:hypothetical protein
MEIMPDNEAPMKRIIWSYLLSFIGEEDRDRLEDNMPEGYVLSLYHDFISFDALIKKLHPVMQYLAKQQLNYEQYPMIPLSAKVQRAAHAWSDNFSTWQSYQILLVEQLDEELLGVKAAFEQARNTYFVNNAVSTPVRLCCYMLSEGIFLLGNFGELPPNLFASMEDDHRWVITEALQLCYELLG